MHNFLPRIIPVLLLKGEGLYKGEKFKNHHYIGDPLNIIKIFNEKGADELMLLDIEASKNQKINFDLIAKVAGECFMPLTYGGGIKTLNEINKIIQLGVEKIVINTSAFLNKNLIKESVKEFGSSTVSVCVDYKKDFLGKRIVYHSNGSIKTIYDPKVWIMKLQNWGVGEIILQNIDRDGTFMGYDFEFISSIKDLLKVPLVISGGARGEKDFKKAIKKHNILNMAGGSCFCFIGVHRAVLITYPDINNLNNEG